MKIPKLISLIDESIEMNLRNPVVVEGKHDVSSLEKLGFRGNIIKLNLGISLENFITQVSSAYQEVILLLDFDREGNSNTIRILKLAHGTGCVWNTTLWEHINRNYNIKSVEDLPWLVGKVMEENNGNRRYDPAKVRNLDRKRT